MKLHDKKYGVFLVAITVQTMPNSRSILQVASKVSPIPTITLKQAC
jgi:hypothetical protein